MSIIRLNRKQKVIELMESFQSFRRAMTFRAAGTSKVPRITPSQWGALMMIEQRGESTVKDIAHALGISSSAATQLVDGLVTSGYVVRGEHTGDRRRVTLTLSKTTKKRVGDMKKQALQKFLKLFGVLNDGEFDQYILLNKKIVGSLMKKR